PGTKTSDSSRRIGASYWLSRSARTTQRHWCPHRSAALPAGSSTAGSHLWRSAFEPPLCRPTEPHEQRRFPPHVSRLVSARGCLRSSRGARRGRRAIHLVRELAFRHSGSSSGACAGDRITFGRNL